MTFLWGVAVFFSLLALVTSVGHACAFAQESGKYFREPPENCEAHEAAIDTMLNELVLDDPDETLYDGTWKQVATVMFNAPFPPNYSRKIMDELEQRGLVEFRDAESEEPGKMVKETYEGLKRFDRWQAMKDSYRPPESGHTIDHSGLDTIRLAPPGALRDGLITGTVISAIPLGGATLITILLTL